KQYHFVFCLMLFYGAYQLIEFTALHHIGAIGYALLGFIFLSIPKLIEDKYQMDKIFRYTSAIVSGCAFIFISVQGMVIRMDDPSLVLLAAYLIIALHFLYLFCFWLCFNSFCVIATCVGSAQRAQVFVCFWSVLFPVVFWCVLVLYVCVVFDGPLLLRGDLARSAAGRVGHE